MKILVINQYFPPDRAATALLLGQLTADLSRSENMTVVCAQPTYNPDSRISENLSRVQMMRIPMLPFSRSNLFVRVINYFLFLFGAVFRTMFLPRHDILLCWTDPPLVGLIGALVSAVKGGTFVFVSQDVYPEIAAAVGKMSDPISRSILRWASSIILNRAAAVVAVGEDMKKRLAAKGCPFRKIHVIPNWQDLEALKPTDPTIFRKANGIPESAFVVMHSGNIGFSQDLETLLAAAQATRDEPDIQFVIVGDGARKNHFEAQAKRMELGNVRFLPYQPGDHLAESLSAADLHYVSLDPKLTGYIVPSKIYGILAVARPVLANVQPGSEVDRIVRSAGCGVVCPPDADEIAKAIRQLRADPHNLKRIGQKGREWIEENGGRKRATERYHALLAALLKEPPSGSIKDVPV
ncbi:MAG TPA: glycosyltransferase family 4 protein [Bdellovibrionota bacterium]|nr:glycosyltransferase family 4 protein [Bdellovibrionota bacterium]